MASNVTIPAIGSGTATPTIATDDVGGVQHQLVKLAHGLAGSATMASTTNPFPTAEAPSVSNEFCPSSADSAGYENNRVAKASAGVLYSVSGYNSKATAQFIQVHNATALPGDGAAATAIMRVEPLSNFSMDFGKFGRYFSTGIVVCNSSTGPTKTLGANDCWFNVQYK